MHDLIGGATRLFQVRHTKALLINQQLDSGNANGVCTLHLYYIKMVIQGGIDGLVVDPKGPNLMLENKTDEAGVQSCTSGGFPEPGSQGPRVTPGAAGS